MRNRPLLDRAIAAAKLLILRCHEVSQEVTDHPPRSQEEAFELWEQLEEITFATADAEEALNECWDSYAGLALPYGEGVDE